MNLTYAFWATAVDGDKAVSHIQRTLWGACGGYAIAFLNRLSAEEQYK